MANGMAALAAAVARRSLLRSSSATSNITATCRARLSRCAPNYRTIAAVSAAPTVGTCGAAVSARFGAAAARAGTYEDGSGGGGGGSWTVGRAAAAALAIAAGVVGVEQRDSAKNCGIVGVVSTGETGGGVDAREYLMEGLSILRNRGYDSAGVATVDADHELVVSKFASRGTSADSMELLSNNSAHHSKHTVGIAHTRWATHGGKTDKNAHPHMDFDNRIALVHNGTINNAHDLRTELQAKGIEFRSETDTEVIAHLIGMELSSNSNISLKDATAAALTRCDGTWGLAILHKDDPQKIVVACNGSPMVIGLGQGDIYVASETAAFSRYTKNFIAMKDGEIGVIGSDGCSLDMSRIERSQQSEDVLLSPAPYPHWTLRECMQQPEAIARSLAFGGRMSEDRIVLGGFDRAEARLKAVRHLVLTACGTSLYASMYGAKIMRDLEALDTATAMDAGELRITDIPRRQGGLLAVSQSGETRDLLKALQNGELAGVARMSVVNTVGSAIARETQLGVYLNAGRETAVASTKAFTTQVTVLGLIALWFRQLREAEVGSAVDAINLPDKSRLFEALQRLPISFGMAMRVRQQCKEVAQTLVDKKHLFVLGKGYGEPVAYEGALKLKEMTYLHAEGYSGGALKHGPFALIDGPDDPNGATPIILIILDDEHAPQMRTCAEEVKARGAQVTVITDNPVLAKGLDPKPIVIPNNGILTGLIAILPMQLIAYELALAKGVNPDIPRNLAKSFPTA